MSKPTAKQMAQGTVKLGKPNEDGTVTLSADIPLSALTVSPDGRFFNVPFQFDGTLGNARAMFRYVRGAGYRITIPRVAREQQDTVKAGAGQAIPAADLE